MASETKSPTTHKRGGSAFSGLHLAQMAFSVLLLLGAAATMVGGGYVLGMLFMVAGTVLGLIDVEGD